MKSVLKKWAAHIHSALTDCIILILLCLIQNHYGKYGILRKQSLKNHHKALCFTMLTSCNLITHLNEIDDKANEIFELLVKQMKERQGISEALKDQDQMGWLKAMNNNRNSADGIVLNELVFS